MLGASIAAYKKNYVEISTIPFSMIPFHLANFYVLQFYPQQNSGLCTVHAPRSIYEI